MKRHFIILSFVFLFNVCFAQQFDLSYTGLTSAAPTSIIKKNNTLYHGTQNSRVYYSSNNVQVWLPIYFQSIKYSIITKDKESIFYKKFMN